MKELYEKVANDTALQGKFAEILRDAETDEKAPIKEKLVAFAKEAGYEVSFEEIGAFFKSLLEETEKELSDAELEMAAGGKGGGFGGFLRSIYSYIDPTPYNRNNLVYRFTNIIYEYDKKPITDFF